MGQHSGKYDTAPCPFPFVPNSWGSMLPLEEAFFSQFAAPIVTVQTQGDGVNLVGGEVWNAIEERWKAAVTDPEAALRHYHDSYLGWFSASAYVDDKDAMRLWLSEAAATKKTEFVRIFPVSSASTDTVTIAHYNYVWSYVNSNNIRIREAGRYSESWVREGSGWLLISDNGGPTS